MKFSRHEDDVRKFLAGKLESLITDRLGPRGKKGKKRRIQPEERIVESTEQRRSREHEEAVIQFLAEAALAGEFVAEHSIPSPLRSAQNHAENDVPSHPAHELGDSASNDTGSSGEQIISISSAKATPSAPHHSPRKRNWHKRNIPSWSRDDKEVYRAICVHLKIGKEELRGKKAERAALLYRAVLARWRSVYKEADLLVSGLNEQNVKKMLQRLKRDHERMQRWLNAPSTAEHIVDAMELFLLYQDRMRVFEDGSYAFVDKDGDLSGDGNVIYDLIEDDNDADDNRIIKILKDKGILPPKDYSDVGAMITYMESFRLQQQTERDQWEQEHKEEIELATSQIKEAAEQASHRLEETLSEAAAAPPPDLNAIFGVTPSNIVRQTSSRKTRK